jgi:glycosyltransferase involved in cell wall biosynthesis
VVAQPDLISVIVTTYNWPEALHAVLESLRAQDTRGFEVVIADDGSASPTRDVIDGFAAMSPVPVKHVWHPDEGPRVAAIRNRAIEAAEAPYVVFLDGDCVVLPDFVSTHRQLREQGWFLAGKRSWLRPGLTRRVLARPQRFAGNGRVKWLSRSLMNQCTRPADFVALDCDRTKRSGDWGQVWTCNLGVWRADCFAVNGFDERYLGVGLEDSDFVLRLIRHGVRRKRGDHASIVLHLHHERRSRPPESLSDQCFKELLACDRAVAVVGIREHQRAV